MKTEKGATPIAGPEEDVVADYMASLKDRECRTLLTELVENLDVVRSYLKHKLVMSRASTADLVKLAKRAIDTATSGYYDPWDRRGGNDEVPNYENVREFFEKLRSAGDWKSLRDLGFRVLDKGQRQIMCSHDEGEIYGQIADCIEVVQSAISKSPLSAVEKAHWALEFEKRDEFSFSNSALAKFFDEGYLSKDEWSALADELLADCRKMLRDNRIDSYDLGRPIRHAVKALRGAGRDGEVVDLLKEALPRTKGYASLVDLLLELGRTKEAREWCLKGIADCDNRESGIAADLRGKMRSFAIERGDNEMVAAYDAQSFFSHPSTSAFVQMRETCEKVGKWDEVRQLALQFLENGKRPESKRGWPLPKVDSPVDHGWELNFPEVRLLIELALQEKRHADAVSWYRRQLKGCVHTWDRFPEQGWDVAEAVAEELPEDALFIWQSAIRQNSREAADYAYQAIARAFDSMRPVMERLGRRDEWMAAVTSYREEYRRRKNLVKMLDGLLGAPEKVSAPRRIVDDL